MLIIDRNPFHDESVRHMPVRRSRTRRAAAARAHDAGVGSGAAAAARVAVRLTPRASAEAVTVDGETLRVRVTAPPIDGRANVALVRLLAKRLRVARGAVRIVSGQAARQKLVEVAGLELTELLRRLGER